MNGSGAESTENLIKRAISQLDKLLKNTNPMSQSERDVIIDCKEGLITVLQELGSYGDLDSSTQEKIPHLLYEVGQLIEKYGP